MTTSVTPMVTPDGLRRRSLRIMIVTPEYPPEETGGGGVVVERVAAELSKYHEVVVIYGSRTHRRALRLRANLELKPVLLLRSPLADVGIERNLPPTIQGTIGILGAISRFRPDIVHLHGVGHPMVDMTGTFCRALRIPYISICHGIPLSAERPGPLLKWLYRFYERFLGLPTVARARSVIAVSRRVQLMLEQKGIDPSRIQIAYPVLRTGTQLRASDFRARFAIPATSKIILCLGSLAYRKGQDLALQVAKQLMEVRDDFILCFVGNDEGLRTQLEETVQESGLSKHVAILGRLDPELKESALQECSLVLVPSRDEAFGLVPLEATDHNKPVLISRNAGIVELVKAPELVFDPLDSKSTARRVSSILDDSSLGKDFVELARKSIGDDCWERTISVYENLSLGAKA